MSRRPHVSGVMDWLKKLVPPPPFAPGEAKTKAAAKKIGRDLYAAIGVEPTASQAKIRDAYREMAAKFHPDRNPGDPVAAKKFQEITDAYSVLSNAESRAAYDRQRGALIEKPTGSAGPRAAVRPGAPPPPKKKLFEGMFEPETERGTFEMFERREPARPTPVREEPLVSEPPTVSETADFLGHAWPLPLIWDFVREERDSPAFERERVMLVDVIAGRDPRIGLEHEIAEAFGVPAEVVDEYARRGLLRTRYWEEMIAPVTSIFPDAMQTLQPSDLQGTFFIDWDPSGRSVNLYYQEGR